MIFYLYFQLVHAKVQEPSNISIDYSIVFTKTGKVFKHVGGNPVKRGLILSRGKVLARPGLV